MGREGARKGGGGGERERERERRGGGQRVRGLGEPGRSTCKRVNEQATCTVHLRYGPAYKFDVLPH